MATNYKPYVYQKTEINNYLEQKQDKLVSGVNIKTINGQDILGNGNISVSSKSDLTIYNNGNKNTAFNINPENGPIQEVTFINSVAMGILNPIDTTKYHELIIKIKQNSTGGMAWTSINSTNIQLCKNPHKILPLTYIPYPINGSSRNAIIITGGTLTWFNYDRLYFFSTSGNNSIFFSNPVSTPAYYTSTLVYYNNKIFFFGGASTLAGGSKNSILYVYDLSTSTWFYYNLSSYITARWKASLVEVGGYLYLFGGETDSGSSNQLFQINPSNPSAAIAKANGPTSDFGGICYSYNNTAYFGLGKNTSYIYPYTPSSNTWGSGTSIFSSRYLCAFAFTGNNIYTFGSTSSSNPFTIYPNYFSSFDPTGENLTTYPSLSNLSGYEGIAAYHSIQDAIYFIIPYSNNNSLICRYQYPHGGYWTSQLINTSPNAITLLEFIWNGFVWVLDQE